VASAEAGDSTTDLALPQVVNYRLPLREGLCWHLRAEDEAAAAVVAQLAQVMQLSPAPAGEGREVDDKYLVAFSDGADSIIAASEGSLFRLDLNEPRANEWLRPPVQLSLALARACVPYGGLLLHGALAEWNGQGVLLVASGGTGKTTASRRLPAPWRSVSDDTTLLLRDTGGQWQAHPWPTWSRFPENSPGESWAVQAALPLRGIFHLKRAQAESVVPLGTAQAVGRLAQSNEEVSRLMVTDLPPEQARTLSLQRFEWLCALARAVPMFTLDLSLTGAFWVEIERALGWRSRPG
jgi:SynChlorMet cassette protein ScmC